MFSFFVSFFWDIVCTTNRRKNYSEIIKIYKSILWKWNFIPKIKKKLKWKFQACFCRFFFSPFYSRILIWFSKKEKKRKSFLPIMFFVFFGYFIRFVFRMFFFFLVSILLWEFISLPYRCNISWSSYYLCFLLFLLFFIVIYCRCCLTKTKVNVKILYN